MKTLPRNSRRGIALIVVLTFLVIVSILLVTFITVSRIDRSSSRNYAQSLKAEELGRGALELIIADLQQEIRAGSTNVTTGSNSVYLPKTRTSMVPARYGQGTEPNLIRRSLSNTNTVASAYPAGDYDTASLPPVRASAAPTATASANGRAISAARWNKPQLLVDPGSFVTPDWIYVSRSGAENLGSYTATLADPASTEFILGRYAYAVYDQGGLLDLTVAGYPTSPGNVPAARDLGGKAYTAFADLTAIPGIAATAARDLVDWRNAWSRATFTQVVSGTGAATGFTRVAGDATGSDNTFLGRQDLIDYATRNSFAPALRYLGTFSRELNSPSLSVGTDATLNPAFGTLYRNNRPIRRFALQNLSLLEKDPSTLTPGEIASVERLFGLTPAADASATHRAWTYRSATIGTPQAAISSGRDPDLFELMKAAIVNQSLGVAAQNTGLVYETGPPGTTYSPESNVHHQVARLIANMADQTDVDNYPTTIRVGATEVYGIESLPYFSEIFFKAHFPAGFPGASGALYAYFELWNPHQGTIPAAGPVQARIVANADARVTMNYIQIGSPGGPGNPNGSYARVNSAYPELPPSVPFPTTPIVLDNLAGYQGVPRLSNNSADTATRLNTLTPVVNGWALLNVNRAIPATWTGSKFTSLAITKFVPALEFQDGNGVWHPYSTFAGHFTALGTTGVQGGGNTFMNNFNGGGASANTNSSAANVSYPKSDPRTFRFRSGVSYSPTFQNPMLPGSPNGQGLDQDKSGGTPSNPGLLYRNQSTQTLADLDGVVRPGDGYLATTANPMQTGVTAARPIILNRPFRSVAELGYVFRDIPWKTLDFFSDKSADAGLLDLFCLEDTDLVAGRVSLNTKNGPVLAALLTGSLRDEFDVATRISATEATTIADAVLAAPTPLGGPFRNRADLPAALLPGTVNAALPAIKTQREAAVRALAPNTQTRTWNLLIDVIAESGRFLPKATALSEFTVEGARRYWLHVAIDRITGEVIESKLEVVYE